MQHLFRQPAPRPAQRSGFTLVELLVVIGILLILATMTIGTINLSVTGERIRSGARQMQSLIEGSRDRAIYAASTGEGASASHSRGIRLLVDDTLTEDHDNDPMTPEIATTATTIVYVGSPGFDESQPDSEDLNTNGDREEPDPRGPYVNVLNPNTSLYPAGAQLAAKALIGVGTRWAELAEQKLIRPGARIRLGRDTLGEAQQSTELLTIHPASFPIRTEQDWFAPGQPLDFGAGTGDINSNGTNQDEVIFLATSSELINQHGQSVTPAPPPPPLDGNWHFAIETESDLLPGEEASVLPRNCCIDLQTSHLPSNWVTINTSSGLPQYSNRMDLRFSPNGAILGKEGAAGVIHLHVCHTQDALDNVPPGSQTLDGLPDGTPRHGEEFGVTIFTQTGRVIVHPIDWGGYPVPAEEVRNLTFDDAMDFDGNPNTKGYWQPSTAYAAGDIVAPWLYDGNVYVVATAGSSGGSEPQWNRLAGGLTDPPGGGGVVWRTVRHNVWRLGLEGELAR